MSNPIRLAIVGAGLFARDAYLPALSNLTEQFEIVAVCSRSIDSAKRLAESIPGKVDALDDYTALLDRSDIEALCLLVPIAAMASMIEVALAAGKHVISEKPAAANVASGRKLLALPRRSVWMVAEDIRYGEGLRYAAEIVQSGKIGKPLIAQWLQHHAARNGKYFATKWRTDNSFQGGFLLDGGVHYIASLRILLGEIESVSAFSAQVSSDMPPVDTISAALRFSNGCLGTYALSFAGNVDHDSMITIVGDKGWLKAQADRVDVSGVPGMETTGSATGDGLQRFPGNRIQAELADFAEAIRSGKTPRATPEQAVQDVAVCEALLRSGEMGKIVAPERIV